eukprot:scaffold9726_cov119-Isochrysis_galbana.AAC.23
MWLHVSCLILRRTTSAFAVKQRGAPMPRGKRPMPMRAFFLCECEVHGHTAPLTTLSHRMTALLSTIRAKSFGRHAELCIRHMRHEASIRLRAVRATLSPTRVCSVLSPHQ